ncbi:MAG: hypothetical protein DSM106950_04245 [Stigonema ocellatum SAG 48.90 = DSM 106950]|nr:hypothetical protein [Stigonema ocellatum SAG 48.90 = DSM 106950]
MTTQAEYPFVYENFRVVATHSEEKSYYIVRMKSQGIDIDDCCWCSANQPLELGKMIQGYLRFFPDLNNTPTLILK